MKKLLIGTSGYSYKDWIGPVYPAGTGMKDFLALYSRDLDLVELNFSYYTQPRPSILEGMLKQTRDDFSFTIKAHRSLTHEVTPEFDDEARRYLEGIAPLASSGRLRAVLLQFPYSFHYRPGNRRYLDRLTGLLESMPLAVEFRNDEWQRESVYRTMQDRRIALVSVDVPDLPRLPRPDDTTTSDSLGYVRFHGRNRRHWWTGSSTSRYDYDYSDEELSDWLTRITTMMKKVRLLLVTFNNHYKGQAFRNAQRMRSLLEVDRDAAGSDSRSGGIPD